MALVVASQKEGIAELVSSVFADFVVRVAFTAPEWVVSEESYISLRQGHQQNEIPLFYISEAKNYLLLGCG